MSDQIKVVIRVRPLIQREENGQMQINWIAENDTIKPVDRSTNNKSNPTTVFQFDKIFDVSSSNWHVYVESVLPIVQAAMQGFNGTIFAYGQTSSGKTHTIMGSGENWGVIPYSVAEIFETIENTLDREFLLRISYMEIYNETVMDLLSGQTRLKVKEAANGEVYVADLKEEVVRSPEAIFSMLKDGEAKRHFGETNMNERSSRSHTIFRIVIESRLRDSPDAAADSSEGDGIVNVSHLNIVDLAGSERMGQTGATGDRLKEGCAINKSLFTLSNVISKLSESTTSGASGEVPFVNFRDSKLTRILQNSLGGNSKTAIICTITPAAIEETISTLKFASRAKIITNKPIKNEIISDETMLRRCQNQINQLKKQIQDLGEASHLLALQQEKDTLTKQLNEKEDKIAQLMKLVCISSKISLTPMKPDSKTINKNRRITWCPGRSSQPNPDLHSRRIQSHNVDFPPFRQLMSIKENPTHISETVEPFFSDKQELQPDQMEAVANVFPESNEAQELANICETLMTEKQTLEENLTLTKAELEKLRSDFEFVSHISRDTQKLYDDLKRDYDRKLEVPLNSTAEFVHLEIAAYETTSAEFTKEIDDLKITVEALTKSIINLTKERDDANKQCEELFLDNWQTKKKFNNAEKMQLDIERKNVLIKDLMDEIDELKKQPVQVGEAQFPKLTTTDVCINIDIPNEPSVVHTDSSFQTDIVDEKMHLEIEQKNALIKDLTNEISELKNQPVRVCEPKSFTEICINVDIPTEPSVVHTDSCVQTEFDEKIQHDIERKNTLIKDLMDEIDRLKKSPVKVCESKSSKLATTDVCISVDIPNEPSVVHFDSCVQTDIVDRQLQHVDIPNEPSVVHFDSCVQTDIVDRQLQHVDIQTEPSVVLTDSFVQTDSVDDQLKLVEIEIESSVVLTDSCVQTEDIANLQFEHVDVQTEPSVVNTDSCVQTDNVDDQLKLVDIKTESNVIHTDSCVQTDIVGDQLERELVNNKTLTDQLQTQLNKFLDENKRQSTEIEHLRIGISDLNEVSREQLAQAELAVADKNEEIDSLKNAVKEFESRLRNVNESAQDAELKRVEAYRRLQEVQQEKNLLLDRATGAEHNLQLLSLENSNLESYKNKLLTKDKEIERYRNGLQNMTKQYEDACDQADEEEKIFQQKLAALERALAERDRLIFELKNKSNKSDDVNQLLKENEKYRLNNDRLLQELHECKMNLAQMNSKLTLADEPWRDRLAKKEREVRHKEEQIQNLKNELRRLQEQQNLAESTVQLHTPSMSSSCTKPVIAGWTASGSGIMDTQRIYELDSQNHRLSKTVSQLQKELMEAKNELDKLRSKVNELEKEKSIFNASTHSNNSHQRSAMSSLSASKVNGSPAKRLTKIVSESPASFRSKYDVGGNDKPDKCKQQ